MANYDFIKMISEDEIAKRIDELSDKISNDYKGQNLHCVCVLKGAVIFMSQLLKKIKHDNLTIDYISVSSYGEGGRESSGVVKILKDIDSSIEGKNVLCQSCGECFCVNHRKVLDHHCNKIDSNKEKILFAKNLFKEKMRLLKLKGC